MTLHKVVQGIHLQPISWLSAPGQQLGQKLAQSDYAKRLDILYEFIYYLFDSILIPLIRANFYVTESSSHRNRLFYFRHDMWRKLSEPSLATLRLNMYVALPPSRARQKLQSRALGYSHLRLLPKDQGARPITNLRRRQQKVVAGRRALGSSINAQLGSLFSVLNYERQRNPRALGSAMLSVGDIHKRLADFKRRIPPGRRLFFAKVDIKSCFDSIPQEHLLSIVQPLFSQHSYRSARHTEVKALEDILTNDKPSLKRRFVGSARPADETAVFSESRADEIASKRRKVVLADTGNYRVSSRNALYKLLQEHVGDSIVKFGNKHMRQTDGIPQGSVLSSILCSFFYGAFERQELGFLDSKACLLLRLIDDFLLITTEDQLARQFLQVMANGDPKYGIFVNADKSLANFDVAIHGQKVPRLHGSNFFPYCGMGIETNTLELRKDRDKKDTHVRNGLSVETCTRPGVTLRRRVLASLKLQMHAMLLDMSLNSRNQVISTLLGNFAESAMKMHQYIAHLGQSWRVSSTLVRRLIEELVVANTKVCWIKDGARGHISRAQMCWIASAAFEQVLLRKQSQYKEVLVWLKSLRKSTEASMNLGPRTLGELLKDNGRSFQGYVY
jgi:telomerase reverse transcriptase